jgi:hypothetical protein
MKTDPILQEAGEACQQQACSASARRHADNVWCIVYAEHSARYQHEVKCTGAACDYFEAKRKVVDAQALADPRVIDANRLAYGEPNGMDERARSSTSSTTHSTL